MADRQRLAQVLGNLLDNALRHTPAGGLVTVELTHTAGEVMFTVADNGDGIAAEHVPTSSNGSIAPTPPAPATTGALVSDWPSSRP